MCVFIVLCSERSESTDFVMPPGHYEYPFRFLVRTDLPSSFESTVGHVRYTLRANIDRSWKFDHVLREALTVVGCLDLNREAPALRVCFLVFFILKFGSHSATFR